MIWIPIITSRLLRGIRRARTKYDRIRSQTGKGIGQNDCNGSFFKKYFILRGQNAIIVSKDYSRTGGRISGDICVFGHGFLFI